MIISEDINHILGEYENKQAPFDELWAEKGKLHPHWAHLLRQIQLLGLPELESRNAEISRLLKDSGVTYNIYDRPNGHNFAWKLDPIPFLITPETWALIERGVRQRAMVLDLLLKDIYGKRKIINTGILPAELVFLDRNFLRPCFDTLPNHAFNLLLYGVDISRGPDGKIFAISDRTQAPSGWGYTMENRIAMARVLPEFFAKTHVKKIGPFYQRIRDNLLDFAPVERMDPNIVLLTPGQWNETYFEHTYMASMQGFNLVEGQDLMVKDGFVWLKTIGGLEKVDIIVRHLDDNFSDPLSLRPDSQLGVAGLLDVVRRGNVTVANPLGSGVLENTGLMAFMNKICRFYLSEELILPNIQTWWCGYPSERSYVLDNLDKLVIKNINLKTGSRTVYGGRLSALELNQLKVAIISAPFNYVAEEQASFSTSPSFSNHIIEPHHTVLRCFAVASQEDYQIMPGGLTRTAPEIGNAYISNQFGALGKDTWVLSKETANPIAFNFKSELPLYAYQGINDLPSRTGENLFWVGRYMIRARITARLLRRILRYKAEVDNFEDPTDKEVLNILLKAFTQVTLSYPGFVGKEGEENLKEPDKELLNMILDHERVGSLAHTVHMWKRAANMVRNHWSVDTWRVFDQVESMWRELSQNAPNDWRTIRSALDNLVNGVASSLGFTIGSLSVEEGRHLFDIGMDLEKCLLLASLLRATLPFKQDRVINDHIIENILLTTESLSSYRHRYRGHLQMAGLLELALLDNSYPQSLAFAVANLRRGLAVLPRMTSGNQLREDEKEMLRIYTALQLAVSSDLVKTDEDQQFRKDLDTLLENTYQGLSNCSGLIMHTFFTHTHFEPQKSYFLYNPDF